MAPATCSRQKRRDSAHAGPLSVLIRFGQGRPGIGAAGMALVKLDAGKALHLILSHQFLSQFIERPALLNEASFAEL